MTIFWGGAGRSIDPDSKWKWLNLRPSFSANRALLRLNLDGFLHEQPGRLWKIYLFMCLLWVYSHCSPNEESQNLDIGSLQLADFCENTTELWELPKSWWSVYMLIGETELSEVQTLCDTSVREEEQSYLRKEFLIDLHRFRWFQYSLSSVLRQPKILLLTANGVCLGEGLKCSIWELWCCGLEFYLLSHELSLPGSWQMLLLNLPCQLD